MPLEQRAARAPADGESERPPWFCGTLVWGRGARGPQCLPPAQGRGGHPGGPRSGRRLLPCLSGASRWRSERKVNKAVREARVPPGQAAWPKPVLSARRPASRLRTCAGSAPGGGRQVALALRRRVSQFPDQERHLVPSRRRHQGGRRPLPASGSQRGELRRRWVQGPAGQAFAHSGRDVSRHRALDLLVGCQK